MLKFVAVAFPRTAANLRGMRELYDGNQVQSLPFRASH
jgi:hypothetical protein